MARFYNAAAGSMFSVACYGLCSLGIALLVLSVLLVPANAVFGEYTTAACKSDEVCSHGCIALAQDQCDIPKGRVQRIAWEGILTIAEIAGVVWFRPLARRLPVVIASCLIPSFKSAKRHPEIMKMVACYCTQVIIVGLILQRSVRKESTRTLKSGLLGHRVRTLEALLGIFRIAATLRGAGQDGSHLPSRLRLYNA